MSWWCGVLWCCVVLATMATAASVEVSPVVLATMATSDVATYLGGVMCWTPWRRRTSGPPTSCDVLATMVTSHMHSTCMLC